MAWVAVNKRKYKEVDGWRENQTEVIFRFKPRRDSDRWFEGEQFVGTPLPDGTIEKITGKKTTWEDEPLEIY